MSRTAIAFLVGFFCWPASGNADCVQIGKSNTPEPPPPVFVVNGAFCGRVFDTMGPEANSDLDLVNDNDVIIAKARVDNDAQFHFSGVPAGRYHAKLTGFMPTAEIIEIREADQSTCGQPLFVALNIQ